MIHAICPNQLTVEGTKFLGRIILSEFPVFYYILEFFLYF
jgi:hypothetical protein